MGNNYTTISNIVLGELVIPGTHDSGTYNLINPWDSTDARIQELAIGDIGAPDKLENIGFAIALGGAITKGWGVAQSRSITEQLEDGIRSLDLRVCVDQTGVMRICHALYGDRIDLILDEIKTFSDAHPNEIIILSFWAFHDKEKDVPGKMRAAKHTELINMIKSRFGNRIADLASLTPKNKVSDFVNAGKTVVVAYGNESAGDESSQDREGAWTLYGKAQGFWIRNDGMGFAGNNEARNSGQADGATKMSSSRVISTNRLFDTSGTSATGELFGRGLDPATTYPHNLRQMGEDVTPVIVSWLDAKNPGGSFVWESPNVISLDHYDLSCLVKVCLKRNGIPVDLTGCDFSGQTKWGNWRQGYEIIDAWVTTAVADAGSWFDTAWTDVSTFFTSVSTGISSVFAQTFEAAQAGTPPATGVAAGVRHYVITVRRIEVIAAPADWEGDLELYGQIFMVPSPFAFTDPGANKTFWSLPEGDQGRTRIGESLEINAAKNIYVKEAEAAGLQVSMGGVLYDDEFGLFAGVGDHLLELDKTLRSGPLTFDLGSMGEGDSISERVVYSKTNIAKVAVYFTAARRVAPVIPKAPPFEWAENFRTTVTVDRLTRMGTGLLRATAGIPGQIEYLPNAGEFLPPGSVLEVQARFIPDDLRNYAERAITRKVVVPQVIRPIPGRIEAESFDSFFEAGGLILKEATSDTGGGQNVRVPTGGWTAYQISVAANYQYIPRLRVAALTPGQRLQIQIDGQNAGAEINVPNTGGWQNWQTITLPAINLSAGFHRVQVNWVTGGASLNYFELSFPSIEEYTQNFDAFADGATSFQDGSTLTSTHLGQATRVQGQALRMTHDSTVSTAATFLLPLLSTNGLPTWVGFEVSFDYKRSGLFAPEIFSFDYGNLSVRLDVASEFKSVIASVSGQVLPGGAAASAVLNSDVFNPVTIRWSKQSGTGRLSVLINGEVLIEEIATPGFNPIPADRMSFFAKNASVLSSTVEIDNVRLAKLPPETRVLTANIGSADLTLIELGGFSIPYTLLNEGNAPVTITAGLRSDGVESGVGSFVLRPGESRALNLFHTYRGDGQYRVTLDVFSDATAGVDSQGAQKLDFDAFVPGTPSGAKLIARFPLDADGNSVDGRFVASQVNDIAFGAVGARPDSGGAATFNGTSSRIQHPWNELLNPGSPNTPSNFTVTAWARTDGAATYQSVVTSRHAMNPNSTGYILYDSPGGVWEFWSGNGTVAGEWQVTPGPQADLGRWQHLALVYDAVRQRKTLFVDGEPVQTQDTPVAANLDQPFNIGAGGDLGDSFFFKGAIDDVAIFDGALTRSEIARAMTGDYALFEPPPGDRLVGVIGSNLGTLEAVDGRIVGHFTLINRGTAPVTIRRFILPDGVSLDWNGGTLAPQATRVVIVAKEVTGPGPVFWQVVANSDANASVDASGNTHFTLSAVVTQTVASFIVTVATDSGAGSLRQALVDAAAHPGADTVTFAAGFTGPINLESEIVIDDAGGVTVDAINIATGVTVSGQDEHRVFHIKPGTVAAFMRLTIANGLATVGFPDGYGGGVFIEGAMTLTGCSLTGNSAFAGGGAFIASGPASSLTLNRCTVSGNAADYGGGIQNEGTLVSTSSTFALNTAIEDGGAISSPANTLTLIQTTVASNTASGNGGGIKGDPTIQNSVIAGNTAPTDPNLSGIVTATGVNLTDGDPLLAPLGQYGGPTETMALLPGSPARDAATNSAAATDQRGLPMFGPPDIGAFEAQPVSVPRLSISRSGVGASLVVSWEIAVGFVLERTDHFTLGAAWTNVPFTTIGNTSSASVSPGASSSFFRLRQQ
ncbi:MAG TPA: LamG-like jellyroll fold domain-containing protein [Methylomirabilota bacterium]|nr:LamG-like jellyroll fold domain-containing protein [Methylomirabilota bacterium]